MSIYLKASSVLLDGSGNVTTDITCCCQGACCAGDGTCTIESESDCTGAGGTYQGNGTVCDPNPCASCIVAGSITLQDIYTSFFFESQSGNRLGINYNNLVGRMYWDQTSHIRVGGSCFMDSHITGDVTINSDGITGYSGSGTATQSAIPTGCGAGACGDGIEECVGAAASFSLYTSPNNINNGNVRCLPCGGDLFFNAWSSIGSVITSTAIRLVTEYPVNTVSAPNTSTGVLTIDWTWSNPCP